jgi:hypothetical protein
VWLDWKQYYIFNKELTKKDYENKLKDIFSSFSSVEKFKKWFSEFQNRFKKRNLKNLLSENAYWNVIRYSKNIIWWFDSIDLQDSFHSTICWIWSNNIINSYAAWLNSSFINEVIWNSVSNKSWFFAFWSWNNSYYFIDWRHLNNCFLVSWLIQKEYCLLNKQYTKEEYEKLVPKVIEKMESEWIWWKFFDTDLSPFPYNDTIANDYFPVKEIVYLDKDKKIIKKEKCEEFWEGIVYILESKIVSEAILDLWWEEKINIKWRTENIDIKIPKNIKIINSEDLPEKIEDIKDEILKTIIICSESNSPFKIIKEELEFYRKYNLPIPRFHPDIRFKNRLSKRHKNNLYLRNCNKCKKEVLTVWENNNIVCEKCLD